MRKRGTSAFTQPGGKIEPREAPLNALVRELREELGLAIDPPPPPGSACSRPRPPTSRTARSRLNCSRSPSRRPADSRCRDRGDHLAEARLGQFRRTSAADARCGAEVEQPIELSDPPEYRRPRDGLATFPMASKNVRGDD
ncbi:MULTISPECIES: NUDIX domain-containing protein [unclassified Mesorhizobium]|uniref:NUDIX domain-containing protein n=1 Tax=unclassified Mesorhizobium TaxID=325217 RepID=UPI001FEF0D58|nr:MULTISPECIES: NUDIX domain-containing protein [unclassified Mesorhizobium]